VLGDRGELVAAEYLASMGYCILERKYRFKRYEIDLICISPGPPRGTREVRSGRFVGKIHSGTLVFVEVKSVRSHRYGHPECAVDSRKQQHITTAARAFIASRKFHHWRVRFDVISVDFSSASPGIQHLEDAFWV